MTREQLVHHCENEEVVARIAAKWRRSRHLSERDQRRLMIALQRMRMSCDSSYLLDEESDHGTKAGEILTLLGEIFEEPGTKVVIFSQWLRMHELLAKRTCTRPMRCSSTAGFHGRSTLMTTLACCRLRPTPPASVERKIRHSGSSRKRSTSFPRAAPARAARSASSTSSPRGRSSRGCCRCCASRSRSSPECWTAERRRCFSAKDVSIASWRASRRSRRRFSRCRLRRRRPRTSVCPRPVIPKPVRRRSPSRSSIHWLGCSERSRIPSSARGRSSGGDRPARQRRQVDGTHDRGAAGRRRLDVSRGADAEPRGGRALHRRLAALLRSMLP